MDPTVARASFETMATNGVGVSQPDSGVNEFESFIHADLCAAGNSGPEVGANHLNFMSPYALNNAISLNKLPATPSDVPSMTMNWAHTATAPPSSVNQAPVSIPQRASASSSSATSPSVASEPFSFHHTPVWTPAAASHSDTNGRFAHGPFSSMAPKSDPDTQPPSMMLKSESSSSSIYATDSDEKRQKVMHPNSSILHDSKPNPSLVRVPPDMEESQRQARNSCYASRRLPPSASQITEAGKPFPVIDTSAKHSSLFIPPDTSGLTKREARLVKNRAAAFLSRQRKREQFDELSGKCRSLARLAWLLYESFTSTSSPVPAQSLGNSLSSAETETNAFHASLNHRLQQESDEVRSVFGQLKSQQGVISLESQYEHADSCTPKSNSSPPTRSSATESISKSSSTDNLYAQLQAARADAAKAHRDAELAQIECQQLRERVQYLERSKQQDPTHHVKTEAVQIACAKPCSTSPLEAAPDAMTLFALVGMALVQSRTTGSIPAELLHELQSKENAPLQGLLSGTEEAGKSLVQLRVSRSDQEAVVCTVTTESDSDRARSSTPDAVHADGSSDSSVPSLSSASPTLSSFSSSSGSARRTRRVLAFYADANGETQSVAHLNLQSMRDMRAWHLDSWAATHLRPVVHQKQSSLNNKSVQDLAEHIGDADLAKHFLLVISVEEDTAPLHLTLYARPHSSPAQSPSESFDSSRVAKAIQNAVRSLSLQSEEQASPHEVFPSTDPTKHTDERATSLFQVTFRP
ncbi:hypothetical protein MYAM1_002939 [Malassezia yamatoensis]|uniref:BZIP domain-containing protein n=1 Tax=Malassezia yamatoensis TaxID=253288 RepID=A0AAJ5YWV3_9BASI|nr:hypothetical protein MYAM1_002939 [Malassezia yamatoensis]